MARAPSGARRSPAPLCDEVTSAYDPAFALVQTLEAGEEFATLSAWDCDRRPWLGLR